MDVMTAHIEHMRLQYHSAGAIHIGSGILFQERTASVAPAQKELCGWLTLALEEVAPGNLPRLAQIEALRTYLPSNHEQGLLVLCGPHPQPQCL